MNEETDRNLELELYQRLFRIRKAEEFIIRHYAENEMKTAMHMSMGQEAIAVGVCHALGPSGQVLASYRSHAVYLAKTNDADGFFGELYGRVTGTARGKAGSMHLANPDVGHLGSAAVVATAIPVAVGAAFANKRQRNGKVVAVFFGEGALDEGVFWESLNAVCVMRLPVLFVCEDNGFAVHTPSAVRQGYPSIDRVVSAFACHVFESDSTDVGAIYRLTVEALAAMRASGQPAFLHLRYYRYLEHVGVNRDFDAGYRSESEFRTWYERDPVILQRGKLLAAGWPPGEVEAVEARIVGEVMQSAERARAAPPPEPGELYHGVFV